MLLGWSNQKAEMGGTFKFHGKVKNTYKIFMWKLKGKRVLGSLGRRYEDITKVYIREIGSEWAECVNLASDSSGVL